MPSKTEAGGAAAAHGSAKHKSIDVVTGATSGLGLALIKELVRKGHEVRAVFLENPDRPEVIRMFPPGVIPYIADIQLKNQSDKTHLIEALTGANNIFHLAAATFRAGLKFNDFININVVGTENVLKCCIDANGHGTKTRFIYPSTVSVYGYKRPGETLTETSETSPATPYAETKLMAEQVIKSFSDAHASLTYTILRIGNMYGTHYEPAFFKVFKHIVERKFRYIGSGSNHLTLVNVTDVVNALVLSSEKPATLNRTYNITDGVPYTQRQLFDAASEMLGVPKPTKTISPTLARLAARMMNISMAEFYFITSDRIISVEKMKRDFGLKPRSILEDGGMDMVTHFLTRYKK